MDAAPPHDAPDAPRVAARAPKTDVYGYPPATLPAKKAMRSSSARVRVKPGDALGLVGTKIEGGFEVTQLVSSGGVSLVYRAEHPKTGSCAALKCFYGLRDLEANSLAVFRDRFRGITALLGGLAADQASIVRILGQGWMPVGNKEIPCMLLDWVDGTSLESLLDNERLQGAAPRSAHEVFVLMRSTLKALAAAHSVGLTHRDIKPSNLFVEADQLTAGAKIRVMDYSFAHVRGLPVDDSVTFLTPEYAAPEQFLGDEHLVGPPTDVFSVALVMLEMMRGGQEAMSGDSFESLRDACLNDERRPTPRSFGLDVTDAVELVFLQALEIDVKDRFQSASHFMGALGRAVQSEGEQKHPAEVNHRAGEFFHDPSCCLTRNTKAPQAPTGTPASRARTKPPGSPGSGESTLVGPAPLPPRNPAVITGDTVIARPPARTGDTVLTPAPTLDD